MSPPARIWKVGRETLDLNRPCLLGILNCTPDSFSDGGRWRDASHAVEGALEILEHAVGVDVGGESTRPGSDRVDAETQCARIIPVIEGIRRRSPKVITVDTTLASVAKANAPATRQQLYTELVTDIGPRIRVVGARPGTEITVNLPESGKTQTDGDTKR